MSEGPMSNELVKASFGDWQQMDKRFGYTDTLRAVTTAWPSFTNVTQREVQWHMKIDDT